MAIKKDGDDKIIPVGCDIDCGGRCVLKAHIRNGVIRALETDDGKEPQLRACLRGRAQRQHVYAPDRLKYPMKRTAARGKGEFERVSWDYALDTVANEMNKIKKTHGPSAILPLVFAGSQGVIQKNALWRLLNMFGGFVNKWGDNSCEAATFSDSITYGTILTGHSRDDLLNSSLIIMWGWNPAETIHGTNTSFYLARAREKGVKVICVDPRYNDSVATFADEWIPIKPCTDTAMLIAMAHVIISDNLQNQCFVDAYTIGFNRFKEYVMGTEDGIPKTPTWASGKTGVPASIIEKLAHDYATDKPAALIPGWAAGRSAYGEQFHRAASTLAAITGNIGINGGSPGGTGVMPVGIMLGPRLPVGINKVEIEKPFPENIDITLRNRSRVPTAKIWDAIIKGRDGGYPSDIKMVYSVCGNPLNQLLNTNKGVKALKKVDFVVVHERFMTPTAKYADILLPVNSPLERNDLLRPWGAGPYYIYGNKAIDSLHESKSDFEICAELAPRLGIDTYSDQTEDEWVKEILEDPEGMTRYPNELDALSKDMSSGPSATYDIPDFDEFKNEGCYKFPLVEPIVVFKEQIEDPTNNPFPTPSGKIEIYSQVLANLNNPELPPIPKYFDPWEGPADPLTKKYPLQFISSHPRNRAHSSLATIPWLKETEAHRIWINSIDAKDRGINDWDEVRIFNDRGIVIIPARVTERIVPGVVFLAEGAWYDPDKNGVDRGGCANVLTKDQYSPEGAFCSNTCLVQVEKT